MVRLQKVWQHRTWLILVLQHRMEALHKSHLKHLQPAKALCHMRLQKFVVICSIRPLTNKCLAVVLSPSCPAVGRLQHALGVGETGTFDMATQEALDDYIEGLPNRSEGYFSGFDRNGCISSDPASGTETNVCGLNHDQYLDILFKMGINPLTGE